MADIQQLFNCTLATLALINPVSKIFIVSTISKHQKRTAIVAVCYRSTLVALMILLPFTLTGEVLLKNVFHVTIDAFRFIGGFVLIHRGLMAVDKGLFFELDPRQKVEDLSIVPLAAPMIAGPAAIAASVSFPSIYGMWVTTLAIIIALGINLLVMLGTGNIVKVMGKHHALEALIRITGLIVATIGMQMILDGATHYLSCAK
jgi:multiple antibiotic resistance protein